MARQSGKTMKVDVALPLDIYDTVVRLAEESDAPIHHRSNQRVLSPTVLHLIGLGIQSLEDNPELLTAPLTTGNTGNDPRVFALLERVEKLADRISRLEDNSQVADDVQRVVDAQVSPLVARVEALEKNPSVAIPSPPAPASVAKSPSPGALTVAEFKERIGTIASDLSDRPGQTAVKAFLSRNGLDKDWDVVLINKIPNLVQKTAEGVKTNEQ